MAFPIHGELLVPSDGECDYNLRSRTIRVPTLAPHAQMAFNLVRAAGVDCPNTKYNSGSPVKIGDTITATAEVAEKDNEARAIRMALTFTNENNEKVAVGEARVKPPLPK